MSRNGAEGGQVGSGEVQSRSKAGHADSSRRCQEQFGKIRVRSQEVQGVQKLSVETSSPQCEELKSFTPSKLSSEDMTQATSVWRDHDASQCMGPVRSTPAWGACRNVGCGSRGYGGWLQPAGGG